MSLQFLDVRQLGEQLSCSKDPNGHESSVHDWFERHRSNIQRQGQPALALLSSLLPEKRADRVYGLRARQPEDVITKAACLGPTRISELRRLQGRDGMDFASAIQQILAVTDDFSYPPRSLTVEEVDENLDQMASLCAFSSPKLRESAKVSNTDAIDGLVGVLRRLPSME